jgi:threonine dehydrogenase-like Zn-dependent dehydrogenase
MDIAVIGCGPVALCAIVSAQDKFKPRRIFAIDSNVVRLNAAKDLGCIPINFKDTDPVQQIQEATNGYGVHAAVEGVGLSSALKTAFEVVSPGGKISSFGEICHRKKYGILASDRHRCS